MSGAEHDHTIPADLIEVAGALDALGASERHAAPAGMDGRIFEGTRGLLAAAAAIPFPTVTVRRRVFTGMRMAAAVAICGATVALWIGNAGPRVAANGTLEDDVDVMLALRSMGSVGERIDLLFSDTAAVRDSLKSIGDNLPDGDPM